MAGQWEPGKEYLTRDGSVARVYATDGCGDLPVHGAILADDIWQCHTWGASGRFFGTFGTSQATHKLDLMPPKPPVVVSETVLAAFDADARRGVIPAIAAAITQYLSEQAE